MVIGDTRLIQHEPTVRTLTAARDSRILNYPRAHFLTTPLRTEYLSTLITCCKIFFEESPHLTPAVDSLLLPVTRPFVVEETVARFRVHVKLVALSIFFQL